MKKKLALICVLLTVYAGGRTFAQETNFAKALLWEISGNGLSTPSYLYGTIHIVEKKDFFLTQSTIEAFSKSKILATEQAAFMRYISKEALYKIRKKDYLSTGQTVANLLTEAEFDSLKQFAKKNHISQGEYKPYLRLKPIYLSGFFFHKIRRKTTGYEEVFWRRAAERNKVDQYMLYEGLEEYKNTLAALDSLDLQNQVRDLMEDMRTNYSRFDEIVNLYKDQDIEGIYRFCAAKEHLYTTLVTNRNLNWLNKLEKLIHSQPTFIAVGSGHLAGETGLIQLLINSGYTVQPVMDSSPTVPAFSPIVHDLVEH